MSKTSNIQFFLDKVIQIPDVEARINTLIDWLHEHQTENYDDTQRVAEVLFELCEPHFPNTDYYQKGLITALRHQAEIARQTGRENDALEIIEKATSYITQVDDTYTQINVLASRVAIYATVDRFVEAYEIAHEQLELSLKYNYTELIRQAYNSIGVIANRLGYQEESLQYHQKALSISRELGVKKDIAIHLTNTASVLLRLEQYQNALTYLEEAQLIYEDVKQPSYEILLYGNLGRAYHHLKRIDDAITIMKQGLSLADELNMVRYKKLFLHDLATYYLEKGNFEQAKTYHQQLDSLMNENDKLSQYDSYLLQSRIYEASGDFEQALVYYKKYHELRDEVRSDDTKVRIEKLETKTRVLVAEHEADKHRIEAETLKRQQLITKKIDRLKDELIDIASHDLRHPLSAMTMELHMLTRTIELTPQARKYLSRLELNIGRMQQMIVDLLDFSKVAIMNTLDTQVTDMHAFMETCITTHQEYAIQKNITLTYTPPESEIITRLDTSQFTRVMDNLLSNAVKYTPENGQVYLTLEQNKDEVIISIRDTGNGIPAKDLPHIFDSYYRASNVNQESGTGLGLTIAQTIVEQHQGTISVISEPKIGTTFSIILPHAS